MVVNSWDGNCFRLTRMNDVAYGPKWKQPKGHFINNQRFSLQTKNYHLSPSVCNTNHCRNTNSRHRFSTSGSPSGLDSLSTIFFAKIKNCVIRKKTFSANLCIHRKRKKLLPFLWGFSTLPPAVPSPSCRHFHCIYTQLLSKWSCGMKNLSLVQE